MEKKIKRLKLTILITVVLGVGCFQNTSCATTINLSDKELMVDKVTRVSHLYYSTWNYNSRHQPFNQDDTKVWMREINTSFAYGGINYQGRGYCWGNVNDLKSWTNISEYQHACKLFPQKDNISDWSAIFWSRIPGETNVIYAPFKDGWMKKIDLGVANPQWQNVVNLVPTGASASQLGILCFDWDIYNHLVCNLYGEDLTKKFGTNSVVGWDVNVVSSTASPIYNYSAAPDGNTKGCPYPRPYEAYSWGGLFYHGLNIYSHGHGDLRGDYAATYGRGSGLSGIFKRSTCEFVADPQYGPPYIDHVNWDLDQDWFIAGAYPSIVGNKPNLQNYAIVQRFFDIQTFSFGARNDLLVQSSAGAWTREFPGSPCSGNTGCGYNQRCDANKGYCVRDVYSYSALVMPMMSNTGTMAIYTATDGKFSREDYDEYGQYQNPPWTASDFDNFGTFLIDFIPKTNPADVNNDGSVNIKDIQSCIKAIVAPDSFTTPDQINQLAKCEAVASPEAIANIKDIQGIIREIIK